MTRLGANVVGHSKRPLAVATDTTLRGGKARVTQRN
jgi:hypothetical protein